eukprot:2895581-Rhodomonas_salina.3
MSGIAVGTIMRMSGIAIGTGMRCPVQTKGLLCDVRHGHRDCNAMTGAGKLAGTLGQPICLRARYAMSGTDIAYAATSRCAMSSTDIAYAAARGLHGFDAP